MAIYSVGRKRVILALLLTTVLLITLDLRGNPLIDAAREGFTAAMEPVQSATGVVTNPLERAWNGIVNYDDLEQENVALQEQVDRLIGTQAAAEATVIEGQELQALYSLPSLSGIDTEVARVVGYAATNLDQVIEINKGSSSGIEVGMPVVNQAGLVGKVTKVTTNTARVMLVTDARYAVTVKVTSSDGAVENVPTNTTPSGLDPEQVAAAATTTTSTTTTTTLPGAIIPGVTLPGGAPAPATTLPGATEVVPQFLDEQGRPLTEQQVRDLAAAFATTTTTAAPSNASGSTTTTTTTIPIVDKEYGALEGRGRLRLPQIRFVQDTPALAELKAGDLVETAGGSESLAPPGIPVGRVLNRANRPGSGGPLLDVELNADLSRLNFVRVVLYKSLSEVEQ
jgi:rod shape-determining protein MreC